MAKAKQRRQVATKYVVLADVAAMERDGWVYRGADRGSCKMTKTTLVKVAKKKGRKEKEPTVRELLDDIKRSIETLELIEKINAGKPVRVQITEAKGAKRGK